MIIIVYFCDGIVLHVVQIGCAKIWCQSYLYGPAVQMYVEMSWGGAVGGRSERSTKIRKICFVGRLLLRVFFRWCVFWSNCFFILQHRPSLGSY